VYDNEKVAKIDVLRPNINKIYEREIQKHHAFFMHTKIGLKINYLYAHQPLHFLFRFTRSVSLQTMKGRGGKEHRTTLQKMFSFSFL
jgi:hypothetical protein